MKKALLIIVIFLFLLHHKSNAQKIIPTKAEISDVIYSNTDDKVYLKYDIIYAKKEDLFNVHIKAFNDFGDEIVISSVTGDLDSVSPGVNKVVIWHMNKDLFQIDDNVYFEVSAELITPHILQPINKGKAYLFSTLFPGVGTYRLSSKKYHLTKGFISYGLVAASIYNGLKANSYYEDYLNSNVVNERNTFYNKSEDKQSLASIYAISAASLWLLEYVNIYMADNKVLNSNVELGLKIDSFSKSPLLSFNIKF
jgi:hypothetical protein